MLTNDVDAVLTALVAILLFYGLARMADRTFLELREFFRARGPARHARHRTFHFSPFASPVPTFSPGPADRRPVAGH